MVNRPSGGRFLGKVKLDHERTQRAVYQRFSAKFMPCFEGLNCGVSQSVGTQTYPVNGLRHAAADGTTGWFIYSGECYSTAPDFFDPLCTTDLMVREPLLVPYLGLAPGWRFLITPDYEDVWFDPTLLCVDFDEQSLKGFLQ